MHLRSIFYTSNQGSEDGIDFSQKLKEYLSVLQNFSIFVVTDRTFDRRNHDVSTMSRFFKTILCFLC